MAAERLNQCDNIVDLAKALGIGRRLLYPWREKLQPLEGSAGPPATSRESTLRSEANRLTRLLAEKVVEVDFSTVPCNTSRRDASGAGKLAGRHLCPDPGPDVEARRMEDRADVPRESIRNRHYTLFEGTRPINRTLELPVCEIFCAVPQKTAMGVAMCLLEVSRATRTLRPCPPRRTAYA